MKNKPDPALLETSYVSIQIKSNQKRTPKSRETIPLTEQSEKFKIYSSSFSSQDLN
jgi:hypothetical protein